MAALVPFAALFKPKVTLEQLRYRAGETPSFAHNQRHDDARKQLELALQAHKHAPRFQRRQDAAAARAGRATLAQLQTK